MRSLMLAVLTLAMGCAGKTVHEDDVLSWDNTPVADLEMHPVFSQLPLEKRKLSSGDELWIYQSTGKSRCQSYRNSLTGLVTTSCDGPSTCSNQFLVRKDMVVKYRPVGACYTDCSTRPETRKCVED